MKNIKLLVALFCLILTGCSSSDDEIPITNEPFARANQLQLYYSSDTKTDLLDLNNNTILPITYEESYVPSSLPPIANLSRYDYAGGMIKYDSELKKYYWNTVITGKKGHVNNRIFIRISEKDIDTMDVKFKFTKEATGSSDGYYALIDKLYYNKTLILHESQNNAIIIDNKRKIFIQKKGTKTEISFME